MSDIPMPLADVAHWIRLYIEGSDNPDLRAYARTLDCSPGSRFLWLIRYIVELGNMQGGRVLDVGCGFAWDAVAVSLLGGCHVVANDIRELMTSTVKERVAAIRDQGAPVSTETLTGDICTLSLEPASFDAVVCNQTIEHVRDLEGMLNACHAALKPRGQIVITNDNNALVAKQMDEVRDMWARRDTSWEFIEELKLERPIENRDIEPYAVMREKIVHRSNPRLRDDTLGVIVGATAGMIEPEIEQLARNYTKGTPLPIPPELSWCRNPVTGEYCERQLDPFDILQKMSACGFSPRLMHGFRRFPLRLLNRVRFRPLNIRLFQLRRFFILVGRKPG